MYLAKNVKCGHCGAVIRAVYDSRNKNNWTTCSCKKLQVRLNSYGTLVHNCGGNVDDLPETECHTERRDYPDDFITLDEKTQALLKECQEKANALFYDSDYDFTDLTDKYEIYMTLGGNDRNCNNYSTIVCSVKLHDPEGFSEEERNKREARAEMALETFRTVLDRIEAGTLDMAAPKKLYEDPELKNLCIEMEAVQLPHYDYQLYC